MLSVQCTCKKLKARGSSFKNYSKSDLKLLAPLHSKTEQLLFLTTAQCNREQQEGAQRPENLSLLHPEGISYFHCSFLTLMLP